MAQAHVDTDRPRTPEAAHAHGDRRRLKLFVGAAPGVGKTYAMLEAAREQHRQGVDVVVGIVETHDRPETHALLDGLDVIPRRGLEYHGRRFDELDLDAVLARRPALAVVDELAHTNAPGSRHPKRFQDVEELLDAGIDVYSTVNIQHLESLNDVVAQITGVRVRETIPDRVLDRADEVKLIDLSPEELLQRLRDGKVYVPEQAERALRSWFQPSNLTALRELALRETAEHVDQMRASMQTGGETGRWAVAERVMIAVSGGPLDERLVRAGRRIAERRDTPWLTVFVEPPRFHRRPEAEREAVTHVLHLAEQLGAEAVVIPGDHVAKELARYARTRNVSEIVVGEGRRVGWRAIGRRSLATQLIACRGSIDVRVLGADPADRERTVRGAPERRRPPTEALRNHVLAAAFVVIAGLAAAGVMAVLPLRDPGMLFLAAVLLSAVVGGLEPSIFASLLSVLVYDFFFTEPRWSLRMVDPQDYLALGAFLGVAVLTSHLTARVRDQAEAARRREQRTAALYAFSRAVTGAGTIDELYQAIVVHVAQALGTAAAVLVPEAGRLAVRGAHPTDAEVGAAERATATWVWQHNRPAGRDTETLPGSQWLHVPLGTVRGAVGVLALDVARLGEPLALEQRQLVESFAGQAALAIERARVDVVEAIMESIEDGVLVLDRDAVIVHVNEVATAILGCERSDLLGHRFDALEAKHSHYVRLRATVADLLAHPGREEQSVELAVFLRGRDHHYVLRPTPFVDPSGAPAGHVLVLQDVTHLRDQDARREQLVATLSHELRTPLTSQRMAIDLLERAVAPLDGRPAELVAAVRADVERLEDVAQRLLDVSRSRAMSIALERDRVDLRALLARVVDLFAFQAEERGITIATSGPPDAPAVMGDGTKLTWALSNLVANALRYTPAGGRITVDVAADDLVARLTVSDSGPGIPPEERERVFERFAQGSEHSVGAAGLGLAIVRDIVQAHGGRVRLESEVGRGTRFTLELPRG